MRLFLFILFSFFSIHSSNALAASTVTDGQYLHSRIAQKVPITYDDLRLFFTQSPTFSTDCVIDDTIQAPQDQKAGSVFQHITKIPFNGTLAFEIRPGKYGFDIQVQRKPYNPFLVNTTPYNFKAKVGCAPGETQNQCAQLAFGHEQKLPPTEIDGEIAEDGVDMTEYWVIYFGSDDNIYATASIELLTTNRNWIGAPTGQISLKQNYVCQLNMDKAL